MTSQQGYSRGIVGKRGGKFFASTIKAVCDNDLHTTA
jgi:hypothetical protein